MEVREEREPLAQARILGRDRLLDLQEQVGASTRRRRPTRSSRRPARTRRPQTRCRPRRSSRRRTSWPLSTSSRAPAGVSATRYSCGLISLATPIRMRAGRYRVRNRRAAPRTHARRGRTTAASRQRRSPSRAPGCEVAGMTRSTRGSESDPLEERLRPRLDAELARAASRSLVRGRATEKGSARAAERPHHDDGDAELLGQREKASLRLALVRVERQLHRVEASASQAPARARRTSRRSSASRRSGRCGRRRAPPRAMAGALPRRRGCAPARSRRGRRSGAAPRTDVAPPPCSASRSSSRRSLRRAVRRARRPSASSADPYIGDESKLSAARRKRGSDDIARAHDVALERLDTSRARRRGRACGSPRMSR